MGDYEQMEEEERQQKITDKWNPLLIEGSREGDQAKVLEALKRDADMNHHDNNNWNALIWLANIGNLEIMRLLCKRGALSFYNNHKYERKEFS